MLTFKLKLDTLRDIYLKSVEISTFNNLPSHIFLLKDEAHIKIIIMVLFKNALEQIS